MAKLPAMRMLSKISRSATHEAEQAVGKAGESVMHGEVNAGESLVDKLNALRPKIEGPQMQRNLIDNLNSLRPKIEGAHQETLLNNLKINLESLRGKLPTATATTGVDRNYQEALKAREAGIERAKSHIHDSANVSTAQQIQSSVGGMSDFQRAQTASDAKAFFSSPESVRSMPAGTNSSDVWDTAMEMSKGGTLEDLQNNYNRLNANNVKAEVTRNYNIEHAKSLPTGTNSSDVWDRAMQMSEGGTLEDLETAYKKLNANNVAAEEKASAEFQKNRREALDKIYEEARGKHAKPAFSVFDSPVGNTKLEAGAEFAGGVGKEAADATQKAPGKVQEIFQKAKEDARAKLESNQPASQETGFGGGVGEATDPLGDFFEDKLNTKGLSNADKHKYQRVQNDYNNYMSEIKNANGDQEKIAGVRERYGVKANADPMEHFRGQANADATTMDWMMGNHVPQYAAGSLMLGGAVASCFSNKGKMSNSELYGQNF